MATEYSPLIGSFQVNSAEGKKRPQYMAALSVSMGATALGAVLGWTGNVSEEMVKSYYSDIKIDDSSWGWICSLAFLGVMVVCIPIGQVCDILGRKRTMLFLTIPFLIGWLCVIFAQSLTMLYIGRFLTGMAGGAFSVTAPIYTSEIAQKEVRGALGSYFDLFLTIGILFAYTMAMIANMKIYTATMLIPPLIFIVTFFFQPESPVFYINQNRVYEARRALSRLRGKHYNVDAELVDIKSPINGDKFSNSTVMKSLKRKSTRRAAFICFGLMFFQETGGYYVVTLYTDAIFKSSGSKVDPQIATIIIGIFQAIATLIASLVVDKIGRRFLLICSNLFVAISVGVLGVYFTLWERHLIDRQATGFLSFVPIISISVYVIMFSLGMGPLPWVISAELFSSEIKGLGTGAVATFNWFIAFILTKFYLNLRHDIGSDLTFYSFSVLSFIGTVFIYFVVPETKGKTLEEIQRDMSA